MATKKVLQFEKILSVNGNATQTLALILHLTFDTVAGD
jgi:hypothetical protein